MEKVKEYSYLFFGSVFLFVMMVVGTLVMWALSSVITRIGIFGDLVLFSTLDEGIVFFTGSIFGVIILAVVCALAGYVLSITKVEDVLTYEELEEISEWCEGVERGDYPWIPNEIPLYHKILRLMKRMKERE